MAKEQAKKESSNKPITQFRAGNVSASIWKKSVDINKKSVDFYSVTIQKVYKDKDDELQNTNTFNREDLVKVDIVVRKATEYIYLKEFDKDEE